MEKIQVLCLQEMVSLVLLLQSASNGEHCPPECAACAWHESKNQSSAGFWNKYKALVTLGKLGLFVAPLHI